MLDEKEYCGLGQIIDAKLKALSKEGQGIIKKQGDITAKEQENIMWEKGLLCMNYPQQLLDTMLYQKIGLNFALCARQEHRNLRTGPQSQIKDWLTRTDNHLAIVFKNYCPTRSNLLNSFPTYFTVIVTYWTELVTYWILFMNCKKFFNLWHS